MNLVLQCKKKFKGVEMTQSKLTPDELAMLDKYVEYGLQNYFETITAKKVRKAIN